MEINTNTIELSICQMALDNDSGDGGKGRRSFDDFGDRNGGNRAGQGGRRETPQARQGEDSIGGSAEAHGAREAGVQSYWVSFGSRELVFFGRPPRSCLESLLTQPSRHVISSSYPQQCPFLSP